MQVVTRNLQSRLTHTTGASNLLFKHNSHYLPRIRPHPAFIIQTPKPYLQLRGKNYQKTFLPGREFGTAVKTPRGTVTFHMRAWVQAMAQSSCQLPTHAHLGDRHLGPHQPHRRPGLNSQLLASSWPRASPSYLCTIGE